MNNTTVTEDLLRTASRFWLMKSEPGECSIDDALAAPGRRVSWFGIRNYQARNFMRDDMTIGDAVLFYHSGRARAGGHASASEGQSPLDHARREGGVCLHRQKPSLA